MHIDHAIMTHTSKDDDSQIRQVSMSDCWYVRMSTLLVSAVKNAKMMIIADILLMIVKK